MKIITRLFLSSALLLTLILLSNCKREIVTGPNAAIIGIDPQPSATEFIERSEDLSELKRIMDITGWDEKIMTTDSFTFFAPTNDAFKNLIIESEDWNSINDIPMEELTDLLDYHLVKNKGYILRDTFTEFIPTTSISSFDGNNSLFINTEGSIRINGERSVALQDVRVKNAVIHMMGEIATPITVTSLIDAHPELSTFAQLFEREDIATNVNELLSGDGPFTIFAPSDSAFIELFAALEINSLSGISADILEQVLLYHIVSSENLRSEKLMPSAKINTLLSTQELTVGISNNIKNVSGTNGQANLISADGQGSNGVIHIIDKVLLPMN